MPRRHTWTELPETVRVTIEQHTGPIRAIRTPEAGKNSEFLATLRTDAGSVFCKGVRTDRPYAWTLRNEAALGPFLPPLLAPRLLWSIVRDGWHMLGFEHVPERHPSLSPTSYDLNKVGDLVATMAEVMTPCPPAALRSIADRWGSAPGWAAVYAKSPDDLDPWAHAHIGALTTLERGAFLGGDTLVHSDLHAENMLVEDGHVRVIDWAWSARGAAWTDTAYVVVRLMHAGHTPQAAEAWALHAPAFAKAPEPVITAFAAKLSGMWEYLARSPKARAHSRALADTARRWAQYRLD
ncbi:phosphotransferase [Streptomyces sp. SID3343]|uniref:phosphotransferase family protein n=1 Tax=Streptomyces sp. SID3343 TaxID=2690260 RepID=UPI00136CF8F1|nr:phosphotransferase [Streptomyces sp. SID3343]MYW01851.1 phosphotransferase [Streptomyces sp. SID3343]